jgi:hypothetical protein
MYSRFLTALAAHTFLDPDLNSNKGWTWKSRMTSLSLSSPTFYVRGLFVLWQPRNPRAHAGRTKLAGMVSGYRYRHCYESKLDEVILFVLDDEGILIPVQGEPATTSGYLISW